MSLTQYLRESRSNVFWHRGWLGLLKQSKLPKHAYGSYFYFHHFNQGSSTA